MERSLALISQLNGTGEMITSVLIFLCMYMYVALIVCISVPKYVQDNEFVEVSLYFLHVQIHSDVKESL